MSLPIYSRRQAKNASKGIFLIGLALLLFSGSWWPGIILVAGTAIASREILCGRYRDAAISGAIFMSLFFASSLNWSRILPFIFIVFGIKIILSEFLPNRKQVKATKKDTITIEINSR